MPPLIALPMGPGKVNALADARIAAYPSFNIAEQKNPIRRIILADCQANETWTNTAANTDRFVTGKQSLDLTTPTSALTSHSMTLTFPVTIHGSVGIWVYAPTRALVKTIQIRLAPDPASSTTNFYSCYLSLNEEHYSGLREGNWWFINAHPRRFALNGSVPAWGFDGITVGAINIRTQAVTSDTVLGLGAVIAEDGLEYNGNGVAGICLGFDGGYESQYTIAFRDMQARGWPGIVWVAPGETVFNMANPDSAMGVDLMTYNQLREMYDAGWDVSHHGSFSADSFTTSTTEAAFRENLSKDRRACSAAGFHRGLLYASWGGHHGICDNHEVVPIMRDMGYVCSRGHTAWEAVYGNQTGREYGPGAQWQTNHNWILSDPYQIGSTGPNDSTAEEIIAEVDQAVKGRGFAHLYAHRIMPDAEVTSGQTRQSAWDAMIARMDEHVAAGRLVVMNITQWLGATYMRPGAVRYGPFSRLQIDQQSEQLNIL